ncbi:MAG TPA: M20 family metallopeptidase [Burkholderiales bacterium]|nr:M20 family metallopeptidase [Burkholderiales bacterium]
MDARAVGQFVSNQWDREIISRLIEYIRIPCKSPHFDARWQADGHIEAAVALAEQWCRSQPLPGLRVEVLRLPRRTPLLLFELAGTGDRTVLLYGHLDKQPEMVGWRDGTGPWTPVLEGDKLYGRGAADDGYAVFAALTALCALRSQGIPHARCVGLIECCEESGSYDLPAYLAQLGSRLGKVDLVIGLDSGCGNYDQLWMTTSLRGLAAGTLTVEVLTEGVHSGDASGIVPSSFRIARRLLERLEDSTSGRILPAEFHCTIPPERVEQARQAGAVLGEGMWARFPFAGGTRAMVRDPGEAVLNRTWRPFLGVIGADGIPPICDAGNVLRPKTSLKLSLRIPPLVDGAQAVRDLKRILEAEPPEGSKVAFESDQDATGWNAPATAPWLQAALNAASQDHYGRPAMMSGEGGTIPFMAMLGEHFPAAQFLITGVLGPKSNAHGPNEFLHISYAKRLTACVAQVIAAHARQ